MKKHISILFFALSITLSSLMAQQKDENTEQSRKKQSEKITIVINHETRDTPQSRESERRKNRRSILNDYERVYIKNAKTAHFAGFGMSYIGMKSNASSATDIAMAKAVKWSKSLKYVLSFFDYYYSLGENNLSLVTGLGIEFNSIHFGSKQFLNYEKDKAFIATAAEGTLSNARLHLTYLTVPCLVEINSGRSTGRYPFFFNLGVLLKLKTASSSKAWWSSTAENRPAGRQIINKDLGLKPVNFDLIAQAGKGNWGVFFTYTPFSPFQKGLGPDVATLSCGIKLYFSQR